MKILTGVSKCRNGFLLILVLNLSVIALAGANNCEGVVNIKDPVILCSTRLEGVEPE